MFMFSGTTHSPQPKRRKRGWSSSLLFLSCIGLLCTWSFLCSHLLLGHVTIVPTKLQPLPPKRETPIKHSPLNPKPLNSQIYNPPLTNATSPRLLTYNRHGGRLNNQIIQFIGSIQHAKILKRRLVVPDEKVAVEWTGLLDDEFDIWDLSSLKQEYDIDWDGGLEVNKDRAVVVPEGCTLNKFELLDLLDGGPKHWQEWDRKCPDIINLGNELPLCSPKHSFCGDSKAKQEAYKIYNHLKLSPFMQSLLPPPQPLSVHSRRAGEGGYDWEICIDPTKKVCYGHIRKNDRKKYCNERTMRGNCAIWTDLSYSIKSKKVWRDDYKELRFNLASDGTHDWSIDYDGQFVMVNSTPWLEHMEDIASQKVRDGERLQALGKTYFLRDRLKRQKDLSKSQGIMFQLSSTILEMFSLVNADYFVGGFYSTFSLNVCLLRGLDRRMESNICWMLIHPNSTHAIPPPIEDTINIEENVEESMPPALTSDIEHAFVTSNDGRFFVIDRYRFMFRQPTDPGKIPTYIAVLGQGSVPMTIEKQSSGAEVIHADFRCSMGKQQFSKATIHILKEDGGSNQATDNLQTLFIVCDDLIFDNDVTIQPPLVLHSPSGFSVRIGSRIIGARNAPRRSWDGPKPTYDILTCLLPSNDEVDTDYMDKYFDHQSKLGVRTHVHVYNVNWHSTAFQSILNNYRMTKKGVRIVTRHDWSTRAKSRSSGANNFTNSLSRAAAKMDCILRSRGVDGYAIYGEIDELIDRGSADASLKACEKDNNGMCSLQVDIAPKELVRESNHVPDISDIRHESRKCVNIKDITLPPWDLII